jgi:hypothetical protein
MTEDEIMEAYELINQTFPFLYPYPPYEWGDADAEEAILKRWLPLICGAICLC